MLQPGAWSRIGEDPKDPGPTGTANRGKKMMRCFVLLGDLVVAASNSLWAKCAFATYRFEGQVRSVVDSGPVSEARIFVFMDSAETTLTRWDPEHPRGAAVSDTDGAFEASGWFNTTSGYNFLTGDRCRRRPKTVDVVVSADGFYPVRRRYQRGDLKIDYQLEQTVVLPNVIQLEPEEHRAE